MIVEDSEMEALMLKKVIEPHFNVCVIYCPYDAQSYIESKSVDLILMDINMPKLNGIKLCKKLKSNESTSSIPIIFVTGMQRKEVEDLCWEAGCSDFLIKPAFPVLLQRLFWHFDMKNRAESFQRQIKPHASKYSTGEDWPRHFLNEQCHKSNVGNTPISLVAVQLENYEVLIANNDDQQIEEQLMLVSSLLFNALKHKSDVVFRKEKNRYFCILPDSGPESTRHFTYLITEAIQRVNQELAVSAKDVLLLKIVGVTKSIDKVEGSALLEIVENSLSKDIKTEKNYLCAERLENGSAASQTVYALAG